MQRYAAGDMAAFEQLYARHRTPLYRWLLASCGDADLAAELFQNSWAAVVRSSARWRPQGSFRAWLFSIARHQLIDHLRRQRLPSVALDEAGALIADAGQDPQTRALDEERRARLLTAVAALPAAQREAWLMKEDGELTLEQIAQLTGTGRETIKSRLRYAMARLREALADERP